jgi:hypothetical protein
LQITNQQVGHPGGIGRGIVEGREEGVEGREAEALEDSQNVNPVFFLVPVEGRDVFEGVSGEE